MASALKRQFVHSPNNLIEQSVAAEDAFCGINHLSVQHVRSFCREFQAGLWIRAD
ncbi:hypothetical protein EM595_2627 [Duffyella gerundensis]|uniref:Uncharacterized protein n=1 Tax=Duffyella gerundensis TaxID=1619313 RepID=A0A0U5L296_9GAMM|nr:hypothetical protein EM595_2627 [Duffyella gerundensis]